MKLPLISPQSNRIHWPAKQRKGTRFQSRKKSEINRSILYSLLFSKTTALADNSPRFSLFRMISFSTPVDQIQKCVIAPVAFRANIHTFEKYRQVFFSVLFDNFVFAHNHKISWAPCKTNNLYAERFHDNVSFIFLLFLLQIPHCLRCFDDIGIVFSNNTLSREVMGSWSSSGQDFWSTQKPVTIFRPLCNGHNLSYGFEEASLLQFFFFFFFSGEIKISQSKRINYLQLTPMACCRCMFVGFFL